ALTGPGLRLAPELCELLHQAGNIAGSDAVLGHLLAFARRKRRYQPIRATQFQRHKNCAKLRADSGRSVGRMIEQHRRLQVEWFEQPQSGLRPGRYPLTMESSLQVAQFEFCCITWMGLSGGLVRNSKRWLNAFTMA